jgi:hypothetical protein
MRKLIAIVLSLLIFSSCTGSQFNLVKASSLPHGGSYEQLLFYLEQNGYKIKNVIAGFTKEKTYIKLIVYQKQSLTKVVLKAIGGFFCLPCDALLYLPDIVNPKTFVIILEEKGVD